MNEPREPTAPEIAEGEAAKPFAARIDALMALPPRPPPSIIVIGDDAVNSITLPPQRKA